MNKFNNIRFTVPVYDEDNSDNGADFDYTWVNSGNIVEFDEATHGKNGFKKKTSNCEFLM